MAQQLEYRTLRPASCGCQRCAESAAREDLGAYFFVPREDVKRSSPGQVAGSESYEVVSCEEVFEDVSCEECFEDVVCEGFAMAEITAVGTFEVVSALPLLRRSRSEAIN